MAPRDGQIVIVNYRGTLEDGSEFDSSYGRAPLQFTVGAGEVIPGFDEAVRDLEVGDTKTVTIPADQAYGQRTDEAMQQFPRSSFPADVEPEIGWMVELESPDGDRVPATVAALADDHIVLDFNHPLAGQDLTFEIELVSVGPEPTE